jgi:hypothetical protein
MMDEKDYKESKNDLAMIWDESMLNDFLFPLADEMMKYRMLANK